MNPESITEWIAACLLALGAVFQFLGGVGVARMHDVFMRAQAATKTATLGSACVFLAVAFHFSQLGVTSRAIAVIAFAFLTVPMGAHMLSRAAYRAGAPMWSGMSRDELKEKEQLRKRDG